MDCQRRRPVWPCAVVVDGGCVMKDSPDLLCSGIRKSGKNVNEEEVGDVDCRLGEKKMGQTTWLHIASLLP